MEAAYGRHPESQAGGVDGRIVFQIGILAETVVGLAKSDARAAPCDEAGINWIEELDESVVPWLCTGWSRCSEGLRLIQHNLYTIDPVIDVVRRWSWACCAGRRGSVGLSLNLSWSRLLNVSILRRRSLRFHVDVAKWNREEQMCRTKMSCRKKKLSTADAKQSKTLRGPYIPYVQDSQDGLRPDPRPLIPSSGGAHHTPTFS